MKLHSTLLCFVTLLLYGCGDDEGPARSGSGGDAGASSGGSPSSGGGNGEGSGGGNGDPNEPSDLPPRDVELALVQALSRSDTHNVEVHFMSCTLERTAGCDIELCPSSGSFDSHFGTLSVTSGETTHTMIPGGDGYSGGFGDGALWEPGAPVHFTAEGDDWPAFDETLSGPADLVPEERGTSAIPRDVPLTLEWTGGSERVIAAIAFADPVEGSSGSARCYAEADAGTITIPTAVLQALPTDVSLSLVLFAEDRRVIPAGGEREIRITTRSAFHTLGHAVPQ